MSNGLDALDSIVFQKRDGGYISDAYRNDISIVRKDLIKLDKINKILKDFYTSEKTDYICRMYLQMIMEVMTNE